MVLFYRSVIFGVGLLLLAACGGGGSGSGENPQQDNTAPIADAGGDQAVILGAGGVIIDGTGSSDADNDSLTFTWELIQQPATSTANISSDSGVSTSLTPDVTGTYRVQLTVSDGQLTNTVVVNISVSDNSSPIANAGPDQIVGRGTQINLNGSSSSDPDDQSLTYTWTQLANQCPDVTGGTGALTGESPQFIAPNEICTLIFDLQVSDGLGDSTADRVIVQIVEDPANTVFVDTVAGNDTNPGTPEDPVKSIQTAINIASIAGNGADLYVADGGYVQTITLQLASGISIYGGYGSGWERNTSVFPTTIFGSVSGSGVSNLTIDGLTITDGNSGTSTALFLSAGDNIRITNNVINSGDAANGSNGFNGISGSIGTDGANGSVGSCDLGTQALGGAGGFAISVSGGDGGRGGPEGANPGLAGESGQGVAAGLGGAGGNGSNCDNISGCTPIGNGQNGLNGGNGQNGADGQAAPQLGQFTSIGYVPTAGASGQPGTAGSGGGGGGGGGGQGGTLANNGTGNGGGGGGSGGLAGTAGSGGLSGGGSIGIYLYSMTNTLISGNTINAGDGGDGGNPGLGGSGGSGGQGGLGASVCTSEVGSGGNGGNGGDGGDGGNGGAGSGGPSIGIAYSASATSVTIDNNTISPSPAAPAGSGGSVGVSLSTYEF